MTHNIGLIGAGGIAHAHLPNLLKISPHVRIYSEEFAGDLAAQFGGEVVGSIDEVLEKSDIIDVATPTNTHFGIVKRALEAGKNVISEKPLALSSKDAAELIVIAKANGVQLFPAHVVRYFPSYYLLKEAVDQGRLGELAVLRFVRTGSMPTRAWYADDNLSGGVLMDLTIHDIDFSRWVAGEVVKVSAMSNRVGTSAHPAETAHVILTHASGAITYIAGIWGAPHLSFFTEYSVTGTAGTLSYSSRAENPYVADLAEGAPDGFLPDTDPAEDPYYLELQDYVAAFDGKAKPRVTASDGLQAVRIAEAALTSIRTGQPVEIPVTEQAGRM